MLPKEAKWINVAIGTHLKGVTGTAINLGSSSQDFMNYNQPYIKELVINPLRKKFNLINVDIINDDLVDLKANFLTENGQELIREKKAKVFLVSNLLEHIPNPIDGINSLTRIIEKGSYLILTGPRTFPYHADPIDNLFRPTSSDLRRLLGTNFDILQMEIVRNGTVFSSSLLGRSIKKSKKVAEAKGGILQLLFNFNFIFKMIRNLFYPASAFCLIALKK